MFKLIKNELKKNPGYFNFIEKLEQGGGQLFEEYVVAYKKATLPGKVIWPQEEVVDPTDVVKFKLAKCLSGGTTKGFDILHIHNNIATGYECKWFEHKDSVSHSKISNKASPVRHTKISQLVFCTTATNISKEAAKWEDVGLEGGEFWFSEDVFNVVKNYVKKQKKVVYKPMTPRDSFFRKALKKLGKDYKTFKLKEGWKNFIRIFQHWPAASGKGSFPRLAYDLFFNTNKPEINLVHNPSLVVLKGNLVKNVTHDLGLGNNNLHIVFAGDVTDGASDTEELQLLRQYALVVKDRKKLFEVLEENQAKNIWFHTTPHSYSNKTNNCLVKLLKSYGIESINFAHVDEVHHLVQPETSYWTDVFKDSVMPINTRFYSSANKRFAKSEYLNNNLVSMDEDFYDILVQPLSEAQAVALGYKRKSMYTEYVYDADNFSDSIVDVLSKKNIPYVKVKGTNIVVPLTYYISIDMLVRAKLEKAEVNHTKITMNRVQDCVDYANFAETLIPRIIDKYVKSSEFNIHHNTKIVQELKNNLKIMACDTHNRSTVKILQEVSSIPKLYKHSIVIHCRLLGEGWDPHNGWVDSNIFVDPTFSEIRIYQDANRGSRIGDGSKKVNHIFGASLISTDGKAEPFNDMFKKIKNVADALEQGNADISETINIKAVKSMSKGRKGNRSIGQDLKTHLIEWDESELLNAYKHYIEQGKYNKFGQIVNDMNEYYWNHVEKNNIWAGRGDMSSIRNEMFKKYSEYFDSKKNKNEEIMRGIVNGHNYLLSNNNIIRTVKLKKKAKQIEMDTRKNLPIYYWEERIKRQTFKDAKAESQLIVDCTTKFFQYFRGLSVGSGDITTPNTRGGTREGMRQEILKNFDSSAYEKKEAKIKEAMIKDIRNTMENYYKNAFHNDSNYTRGATAELCKKYQTPEQFVQKNTKDIRDKWMKNHKHYKNQKLKVYKIIHEEFKTLLGMPVWIEAVLKRWDETGIIGCEANSNIIYKLLRDHWKVLSKSELAKLEKMKKDVNVAGRHGNHVIWNKGLKGKNDPRCMETGAKISKILKGRKPWNTGFTKDTYKDYKKKGEIA